MLELKNITKEYRTGDETVQALKGINSEATNLCLFWVKVVQERQQC